MIVSKFKKFDNEIIGRYLYGENSINIAKVIGCTTNTIFYRLSINNIKTRSISESMCLYTRTDEHNKAISEAKIRKGTARRERNPNWKGGISDNWSKLKRSVEYIGWRKAVFARDNYICRGCGYDKGEIIEAHHILRRIDFPHLIFSISNGMTLCKNCHRKAHSKRPDLQLGELLENPTGNRDNQQPSWVETQKVQRLAEDGTPSLMTATSARHESDDIVRSA